MIGSHSALKSDAECVRGFVVVYQHGIVANAFSTLQNAAIYFG
jgi:hypothetical protein